MQALVLFAHGQESGPWGSKIKHLSVIAQELECRVISIDYQGITNPEQRVEKCLATDLGEYSKLIMVGSSMGGYVSAVASTSLKPDGLFLMAPALYLPGYAEQNPTSGAGRTVVVAGWEDKDIPVENAITFARSLHAELHVLPSDHRLLDMLPAIGDIFSLFVRETLDDWGEF